MIHEAGTVLAALVFGLTLALSPGLALAEDGASLEQVAIEAAQTPRQHAAIAGYYEQKAAEARAAAQRHDRMGRAYQAGKLAGRTHMRRHCVKISTQYESLASEFDDLAALHRAESE